MDMSILRNLNLLNNLGGSTAQSPTTPNQGIISDNLDGVQATDDPEYHANTAAMDALKAAISGMPTRAQFQPSKTRQVLAAIAGLGAAGPAAYHDGAALGFKADVGGAEKIRRGILDEPYDKAMDEFDAKLKPLGTLANVETSRNANDRLLFQNDRATKLATRKQEETERKNLEKEELDKQKLELTDLRSKAYAFKQMHPNWKSVTDKDGKLVFINPTNPDEVKTTGIDTGKLSDSEKIELGHKARMEEIDNRGSEARATQDNKVENTANKPESATQGKQRLINRANEIISANPDLAKYFEFNENGVKIRPLNDGYFSSDKEADRNKAYNLLFGDQPAVVNKDVNSNNQPSPTKRADGKTHVRLKSDPSKMGWVTDPNMKKYDLVK